MNLGQYPMYKQLIQNLILTFFLLVSGDIYAAQTHSIHSAPDKATSMVEFPVVFNATEIITISNSPVESLTPAKRASLIQQNIKDFADSRVDINALQLKMLAQGYGIANKDEFLIVITNADVKDANQSSSVVAQDVLKRIQTAVTHYRNQHRLEIYGLGGLYTFLSILGLWLALHFNNKAFTWLKNKASAIGSHWKSGLHFKGAEIISARRIARIILAILKMIRLFFMFILLYLFLPLILSFFPETRQLGAKIFNYLITPIKTIFNTIVHYIPNLFYIFVIIVIAFYVLKLLSFIFGLIERKELKLEWFYDDWARPTYQIVRFLVIITALISAYPYIPGSSSEAFQGIGLVLGAIISFASSSAISNMVAGVILTYTRAFRLNDRIKVGDTIGDVVEKTLLVTRVMTIKQVVVTIPNSLVMGSQIVNYSTSAAEGAGVVLHTSVTIGYDVPWQTVESLLVEAALATDLIVQDPKPFVLQTSLEDWYVSYEINAYTKNPERMAVIYSDMHRHIQDKFDAEKVEIMSPHYLTLRDGNASTVPSVLNTKGYNAPPFKLSDVG
jgi:small-conductance mechanosensitive channel